MPRLINLISYDLIDKLFQLIAEKNILPGQKIPSERDLAHFFEVNRLTLRRALQKLVDDGVLLRYANSGYFLAEPKISKSSDYFFIPQKDKLLVDHSVELQQMNKHDLPIDELIDDETKYLKEFYLEKIDDRPISIFSIFKADSAVNNYPKLYSDTMPDNLLRVQTITTKNSPSFIYEMLESDEDDLLFVEEKVFEEDELIAVAQAYTAGKKCTIQVDVKTEVLDD
ncbi:winged helix-turn-helix domain-containing protein [Enterococcus massiliensis]|uniref:winged helix-turn-helix domain-containing protein n=1 Tax=Enterococcus massiliensis TaxID=1640685 RepID=UPI00065E50C1|nr:winged helix-turn-helix domain-containing protein [Enterococcus massiliensis]